MNGGRLLPSGGKSDDEIVAFYSSVCDRYSAGSDEPFDCKSDQGGPGAPPAGGSLAAVSTSILMNKVLLTVDEFVRVIDDLPTYILLCTGNVTRAAFKEFVRMSSLHILCNARFHQRAFINVRVNLEKRRTDVCPNGCVAFTGRRQSATVCDTCSGAKYTGNGAPAGTMECWSLTVWLTAMPADPVY